MKVPGGGDSKGGELANEEAWESERGGRRGRSRRKDSHGENRLGWKTMNMF